MKRTDDRVVVTGIGVVSPIGIGKDPFWSNLKVGNSGIKPITLFDTSTTRSKLACEITDLNPGEILGNRGLRNLDRTTVLALCATKLCIDDSKFDIENQGEDVGVVLGSTMGSVWSISEFDKEAIRNGPWSVNPAQFPNTVINSPASQISIRFGVKGFNTTISSGFTSSIEAVRYATMFIKLGRARAVLVGGVEELCEQIFKGFYKLGYLSGSAGINSDELLAPFDRRRNGTVLGEGGAVFLLESLDSAVSRGAHIYGEISGSGSNLGQTSKRNVNTSGLRTAVKKALMESEVDIDKISLVSSGANSSLLGDYVEAKVINDVLASKRHTLVNAVKSMIGETFSASGAFQLAASLLCMENDLIHPTANLENVDNRCHIDGISNKAMPSEIASVLITSTSPIGQNAALVLSKYNNDAQKA